VFELVSKCPAPQTTVQTTCCQTPGDHSAAHLVSLRKCVVALASSFGVTVGGKSSAAELLDCADGDGNGEVTSQEASSMLTMCLTYTGGPTLADASLRALRALARC